MDLLNLKISNETIRFFIDWSRMTRRSKKEVVEYFRNNFPRDNMKSTKKLIVAIDNFVDQNKETILKFVGK